MRMLSLSLLLVVLDQFSKLAVRRQFLPGESREVLAGWFNLTYLRNTGAVWGLFQHQNEWLVLLSLGVLLLMALCYRWLVDDRRVHRLAIGCLAGGILGNLVDRVKLGYVTDFLDVHWAGLHWPAFNLADAAICLGVGIYAVSTLWISVERLAPGVPAAAPGGGDRAGPAARP